PDGRENGGRPPHVVLDDTELERCGARRGTRADGGARTAHELRDRGAPLLSTLGASPQLATPRHGEEDVRATFRRRARAGGRARRARMRRSRSAATRSRDDLDRARDRRPARTGREGADLEHAEVLRAARSAARGSLVAAAPAKLIRGKHG